MEGIGILYNEFGEEVINVLIDSAKERLGWTDFISDFSKYSNSTLITDLFKTVKNLDKKQMQLQDAFITDPDDKRYQSSLVNDINILKNDKNKIVDQLYLCLNDLRDMMLSTHSL